LGAGHQPPPTGTETKYSRRTKRGDAGSGHLVTGGQAMFPVQDVTHGVCLLWLYSNRVATDRMDRVPIAPASNWGKRSDESLCAQRSKLGSSTAKEGSWIKWKDSPVSYLAEREDQGFVVALILLSKKLYLGLGGRAQKTEGAKGQGNKESAGVRLGGRKGNNRGGSRSRLLKSSTSVKSAPYNPDAM